MLSSVPALISSLQNEYDAIMLEMFNLKKQYENVRQELAHALYSNDAATRVIARLAYERDQAREALVSIQSTLGGGASASAPADAADDTVMAEGSAQAQARLPEAVAAKMSATTERLSEHRRIKNKTKGSPEGYLTKADVQALSQKSSQSPVHSTKPPGVTALSVSSNGKFALTGGNDKVAHVYDRSTSKSIATLKGHSKKLIDVTFSGTSGHVVTGADAEAVASPSYAVTTSEDGSIRIWQADESKDGSYSPLHTLDGFAAQPVGTSIHPSGEYVAAAFRDGTWTIHDLASGELVLSVAAPTGESAEAAEGGYAYESVQFHPDGMLIGFGTSEGAVRIWDCKSATQAATFRGEHQGPIHSIDFSENGYFVAVAAKGSPTVAVWDLRKLKQVGSIAVASPEDDATPIVKFDPALQFLAVVGADVRIYAQKTWEELKVFDEGIAGQITGAAWDPRNGDLVTVGLDRTMRVFGKATE